MQLIDGRALAAKITASLKKRVAQLSTTPGLAAVLVGDDPASHLYVRLKERACGEIGIRFFKKLLPATATETDLATVIEALNKDQAINGIIIQLPLPRHLDEDRAILLLDPAKDADGFHPQNIAAFVRGQSKTQMPGLVKAVWSLLEATGVPVAGKTSAILSNSPVFAQPLIAAFERHGIRADYVNPKSTFARQTSQADILVVAIGQPEVIGADAIKPGAILIDLGTTSQDGRVVGDVDADAIKDKAAWLTPVPGGVGPMTVAALLENVVEIAERHSR